MHRITLIALLLAGSSLQAEPKPKPPAISVCYGPVCLTELRWVSASSFGSSMPSVQGVLVNNSKVALTSLSLQFDLKSGEDLGGSAVDFFMGQVPPGARWSFHAFFSGINGDRAVTRIQSGLLQGTAIKEDGNQRLVQPVQFDPLFAPFNSRQRKEWEKIYGARQR
jgi:hypothetical protein